MEQPTEARKALLEGHGGPLEILKKVQSEENVSNHSSFPVVELTHSFIVDGHHG